MRVHAVSGRPRRFHGRAGPHRGRELLQERAERGLGRVGDGPGPGSEAEVPVRGQRVRVQLER